MAPNALNMGKTRWNQILDCDKANIATVKELGAWIDTARSAGEMIGRFEVPHSIILQLKATPWTIGFDFLSYSMKWSTKRLHYSKVLNIVRSTILFKKSKIMFLDVCNFKSLQDDGFQDMESVKLLIDIITSIPVIPMPTEYENYQKAIE